MKKLLIVLTVIFSLILLTSQFFSLYSVSGDLMQPALSSGSTLLVLKHPSFKRGDIVIFHPTDSDQDYLGRIIALPGESFKFVEQNVYINSPQTPDSFYLLNETYPTNRLLKPNTQSPISLSPSDYLLLRDNERGFSPNINIVPTSSIFGRMLFKL